MTNKIAKNAAVLTTAKVVTMAISMLSAMLLSRFRTLEEYGTYSQIVLVVNLAVSLFMLGLPNSTNYFLALADSHKERQHFLSVYFTLNTLLCLIMGGVLVLCVPCIVSYFDNKLINSFAYVLFLLPWTKVIISSISNILVVYGKTEKLMVINIVNTLVSLLAVFITKIFHWSFKEYMLLFLLGEGFIMLWVYVIVWKLEKPLYFSLDIQLISKIFKYSIPIGLAGLVGTLNIELDKLMIGRLLDTEQLAIYSNAAKELPLTIVATSLTAVLLPQMARMLKSKDIQGAVNLWCDSVKLSYIIICFFSMSLVVFAPQIITILYSSKYLPGVPVFQVYSLVLLLRCTYWGLILNSIGKTRLIFYSSVASLVLNIILNYILYLALGVIGPALATLISILAANVFQLIFSAKELCISLRRIFPWKSLAKITCLNIIIGIIGKVLVVCFDLQTSVMEIVFSIAIGLLMLSVYVLLMYKPLKQLWINLNRN